MHRLTPVIVGGLLAAMPTAASAAPERVFELISPASKGGSDVSSGYFATADGNAVAYESFAALGEDVTHALFSSTYVARRESDGWKTTSMQPRLVSENPALVDSVMTVGLSTDLSTVFSTGAAAFEPGDENDMQDIASVRDGVTTWVTPSLTLPDTNAVDSEVVGVSHDGDHFVVSTAKPMLAGVPGGVQPQLYLQGPEGLELASRLPDGSISAGARLGNGRGSRLDGRAISADGQTLFFTTTTGVSQLYVRRGGQTTLISADTTGAPGTAPAVYEAATEDGSSVLFSSTSQLTADAPVGGGLYRYDVATDALRLVTPGAIAGVMQTTADLSVVYLVSTAQLVPGAGLAGQPNLYRVAGDGLRFVATLNNQDVYGWTWGQSGNVGGISADGARLVFQTRRAQPGANVGANKTAVYRYDAEDDAVTCLSCSPDGSVAVQGASLTSGDLAFSAVGKGANPSRAITADGRLTVFQSVDALLPEDQNGLTDVYGYDDDGLHLLSGGTPDTWAEIVDVTPDGSDVFFVSTASLTADDVDHGYRDVYTARIGGGFPTTEQPCTASTCDRPDALATVFSPVIGSTGVFTEPGEQPAAKTGFRVSSLSAASRRSWARTGKTRLKVRVTQGAKITATTKLSGRTISTARTSRSSAGTATLTLKLSKAAKSRLKRSGRLKLTVTVSVSGAPKSTKATVKLTAPKAKKAKKKAGR